MTTTPKQQSVERLAATFAAASWAKSETVYFAAVGHMITIHARAEATVHLLACRLSGLPNDKARDVFGGMRFPDLIDSVRGMMRTAKIPDDTYREVDACLVQLRAITNQRNKLAHRMVKYVGEHAYVSNCLTAKSLTEVEIDIFSERDLQNMRTDCRAIISRLMRVIGTLNNPTLNKDADVAAPMRSPWRYVPTTQRPARPKRPRKRPIVK